MSYDDLSHHDLKVDEAIAEDEKVSEILLRTDTSERNSGNIKKLPVTFRKNGFTYVMKTRSQSVALYEQFMSLDTVGYEVCIIKVHPAEVIKGRSYPVRESLPSDEEFGMEGSKAFLPGQFDNALEYFDRLKLYQEAKFYCTK